MLLIHAIRPLRISKGNAYLRFLAALILIAGLWLSMPVAQAQNGQEQATPTPTPKANAPAEAGGPQGDIGPIAVPKKKEEPPPKDDAPKTPKKVEGLDNFSMRVASQLVTVDVGVLSKDGAFIPGLKKEYFRVLEDNVPQTITSFNQIQAPIQVAAEGPVGFVRGTSFPAIAGVERHHVDQSRERLSVAGGEAVLCHQCTTLHASAHRRHSMEQGHRAIRPVQAASTHSSMDSSAGR